MTYEDLPDIVRQKLFYSHQHDKDGFIVYPEKAVLEFLWLMFKNPKELPGANRYFLYAESQMGLNYPVVRIEMSRRLKELLYQFGYSVGVGWYCDLTLGHLVKHPESHFLKTPNFGKVALKELKEILTEFGLWLVPEETTPTQ